MPPKKKAPEVTGPSASTPSPLEQAGGGEDADGGTGVAEPVLGPAASELAPRPSQEARNQQRPGTHGVIRSLDPDQAGGSQGAQGQQAHQPAGTSVARLPGPGTTPSNVVRSSSTSRSTRHSPPLPTTPAEALARAQLLLDYPPTADKLDGWRATIQSLIGFANGDTPRQPSAPQPRQVTQARTDGAKTGGGVTTVHSPHQRQWSPTRRTNHDNDSTASSNPRTRRDQRQVLHERKEEDTRTRIEHRREARRKSDQRVEPSGDMHAPGEPGDLPYSVGCPAFTRELRQVQWPSTKNFKPDVPEKYDGKSHPSEFLSIYTIAVQAAGGRDDKILANYFPLVLKPNVRSWLMHLPDGSISSWPDLCHLFVGAFTGGHKHHGQESDLHLVAQKEGEPLRKFIQRFSRVHYNIPDVHPAAVISAFHQNVRNRRMREEMAMCKIKEVSELYALADKCARAEEGRKLPGESVGEGESDSEGTAPARKGRRRNGKKKKNQEVLVVEKSGSEGAAKKAHASGSGKEVAGCANCQAVAVADKRDGTNKKYCKIHRTKGHDLQSCKQVERLVELQKAEYERRDKERAQSGGGGSGTKRPGPRKRRGKDKQRQADRPPRGRDKDEDDDDDEDMDDIETNEQEFQKATEVLCVDGGASLLTSRHQLKQWAREVNAAEPPVESRRPLKWSSTPIIFDIEDHPDRTTAVGCLPMLVSPTVRNLKVTKMLVDGGAGLNLISSAVLRRLQVPDSELEATGTF